MKIIFFVLGRHMPSTRFRVLQYLPSLAAARVHFRIITMEPVFFLPGLGKACRFWHYLRAMYAAWRGDLVFLQKPGFILNRWIYIRLLFRLQKKVVFDFDDAIFLNHETGLAQAEKWLDKLTYVLARSRLVIAGNPYLADFAKKINPGVEVIPTPIDCATYSPGPARPSGRTVTVGWMGSASNLPYLKAIFPVIEKLLARTAIRFLIVTDATEKTGEFGRHARISWKTWREDTEVEDLRLFDIGIMPLADDAYTRGKCGFKLLQYMAVGIPVVASPVGMNREIVEDGINGLLAMDENEWFDKLHALYDDWHLRHRLGLTGRETVLKKYALQNYSGPWLSLLRQAAGEGV